MIPKKNLFIKFFLIILLCCFFSGCTKESIRIKKEKEFIKGVGYIELNCSNYYFYGDVLVNSRDNYVEVFIYSFGNEILKIESLDDKIKGFYLGNEIRDDYYQLFPVDVRFLMNTMKRYFLEQSIIENNNIFFEINNGKKVLNIILNNCDVRLFLTKDI